MPKLQQWLQCFLIWLGEERNWGEFEPRAFEIFRVQSIQKHWIAFRVGADADM